MYLASPDCLDRSISLGYRLGISGQRVWEHAAVILKEMTAARLAKEGLGLGVKLPKNLSRYVTVTDTSSIFDRKRYLVALKTMEAGASKVDFATLSSYVAREYEKLPTDFRLYANGHDLIEVLAIIVRSLGKQSSVSVEEVERVFWSTAVPSALGEFTLFKMLAQMAGK
jgi:hypothetical protein